jgi:MFS transporter, PPP family, 3-phenylpropionic acid transporter
MVAVSMFLSVAAFGFLEPFVPLYLELSGLRRGQIGLVSGIGTGLALLIQPLLGRLSDRLDRRRPIMFAAAVAAGCAYLGYRGAGSLVPFVLLTAMGVNGIMYLNTANAVIVGRMAKNEGPGVHAGAAFARYRVWGSVGYVVVSLLTGLLLSRGLAPNGAMTRAEIAPLFLYGPVLFFLIAGVVWLLPDPRKEEVSAEQPCSSGGEDEDSPERRTCQRNMRRFLRAYFLYIFAWTGAGSFLSLYLKGLGATPLWITGVFATGVLCEVMVMSQVGRLSDRFGRRPLLALSFLFMPIRLLLYIPATGPLWVLGVQTLHGVNFGIMVAVAVAFVSDLCTEEHRGLAQARLAATSGLAAAIGPPIGGWLAQRLGIPWTFGIMACVAAAGAATSLWKVRETVPHPDRLDRNGPAYLRPVLRVLCVPGLWLVRHPRLRRRTE